MGVPEAELRDELLRRRDIEQDARFAYYGAPEDERLSHWERIRVIDTDNLAFLIDVIGQRGWLGSDLVGTDGARACWLMVQHAPIEYQDQWFPLMEQAVAEGLAQPGDLAYLQDRVNMRHGRPQTYGSQPWGAEGRLWPLSDGANTNALRADVGLFALDDDLIDNAWTVEELRVHGHGIDQRT